MIPNRDVVESLVAIDDGLKAFLESGVSVVVGTRDERFVPEIVRAWGPQVSRDRRSVHAGGLVTNTRQWFRAAECLARKTRDRS